MNTAVHFSSASSEWETPQDLFDRIDAKYHFTLDVCATKENAKCKRFFTKEQDGLAQGWDDNTCWMNPPYGREIVFWMEKAWRSYNTRNCVVVCLVPARTDTVWWHDFAMKGRIEFLKGRLKFGGHKNSAPFPSAIVVFG
jgi:site-specific DNA-methyltransferase (adenine-specific)